MNLAKAAETLRDTQEKMFAYGHALNVMNYDGQTVAPKQSAGMRGDTSALLAGVMFEMTVAPETIEAVQTVLADPDADAVLRRQAVLLSERQQEFVNLPKAEFMQYQKLLSDAEAAWIDAKKASDFDAFAPCLAELVRLTRLFAGYKNSKLAPYDVQLDTFEKGASMATLDPFFDLMKKELTPLIRAIGEKPAPDISFLEASYPIPQQRVLSDRVMALMGLDRARSTIGESAHPFTSGFEPNDVRITTHYHEHMMASSLYSVIHEGGHALYELGVDPAYNKTVLMGGVSMGIHESQSRFYENIIGRSRPFVTVLHPLITELFPAQMAGVSVDALYHALNRAEPSLIRTEADELTYCMHIIVRYELEKRLMDGSLPVRDLPGEWNRLYKELLGVTVPDDAQGVLQDVHWANGAFGYFPSYALGSAYGAQMLRAMQKDVDVWATVAAGRLQPINAWLDEKIHRYGQLLTPEEVFRNATGESFDPQVFVDYLRGKYTGLYGL